MPPSLAAADVIAAARSYVDVPFRHQGRSREGLDCLGLLICAAVDLGLPYRDNLNYGRTPDPRRILKEIRQQLIPADAYAPGLVVLLRWGADTAHFGLITDLGGRLGLIHAAQPYGRVVEHGFDATWRRRRRGLFAIPGVAY